MGSSDSDNTGQTAGSRKRQRSSATRKDGDEAKKSRGRPRVEAQDETAADRRRTQIRLAQRAYRQRKESTISSLKKQVNELQGTIEEMKTVFLQFNDRAFSSGSMSDKPELMREFKSAIEQFATLARNAAEAANGSDAEEGLEDDVTAAQPTKRARTSSKDESASELRTPNGRPDPRFSQLAWGSADRLDASTSSMTNGNIAALSTDEFLPGVAMRDASQMLQRWSEPNSTNYFPWLDELAPVSGQNTISIPGTAADGYNVQLQQFNAIIPTPTTSFDPSNTLTLADAPYASLDPEPVGLLSPPYMSLASPAVTKSLGLPFTFSFQENTFSRRLGRAAVERGFHLLAQSELRPHRFNAVFRLSLLFSSKDQLYNRFKEVLARSAQETLDNCGGPFQHLGGAGTHYPRKDAKGHVIPRPEDFTERRVGPLRIAGGAESQALGLDLASAVGVATAGGVNLLDGFEGEWFDADDVAGYLEERGLTIPAQASFVEGEVEGFENSPAMSALDQAYEEASMDFSALFEPSAAHRASIAAEKARKASLKAAAPTPTNNTQWNGSFIETEKQNPFDLSMGNAFSGPPADLSASSTWYDGGSIGGSAGNSSAGNSSPGLTTATTAPSIGDAADWQIQVTQKRRRTVTVEVAKLIDELIRRCVCIGRTAGFRRGDVDNALRASVISIV